MVLLAQRVILVAPYPPPYGGNSVHVKRLCGILSKSGVPFLVIDPFTSASNATDEASLICRFTGRPVIRLLKASLKLLGSARGSVVHFHVSAFQRFLGAAPFLLACSTRASKRLITIHSGSFVEMVSSRPWIFRFMVMLYLT